jgi:D-3-phosphoglycerate dehydrogenase
VQHVGPNGRRTRRRGRDLAALTVGLVGFGAIGQAVAARLGGFGCRLIAYDPYVDADEIRHRGVDPIGDLPALAADSDIVSLHAPGGHVVVDGLFLTCLPAGAILVNTARGNLIDEDAVAAALHSGRLGGFAADVLAFENPPAGPLLSAPHVLLTPHIAADTEQAVDNMGMEAAKDVIRILAGQPPLHPVVVPGDGWGDRSGDGPGL